MKKNTQTQKNPIASSLTPPLCQGSLNLFVNAVETVQEYWRKTAMAEEQCMGMAHMQNHHTGHFDTH